VGKENTSYFFKDKPIFGLDIGHGSLKVMQIDQSSKKARVIGYGSATFDGNAIKDGVVMDHAAVAKATFELFKNRLIGDITTNRAVVAIPSYRTFSRLITLPPLTGKDLHEAVTMEAEQYIPMPLEELYLDYKIVNRDAEKVDLFAIAVPARSSTPIWS
jgi:type IV pilus assembly protein PilM